MEGQLKSTPEFNKMKEQLRIMVKNYNGFEIKKQKRVSKAELRARVGRPQTSSSPPVILIASRPRAALLLWFFGDFRCGALLFMVIHVIYKYKNR